MRPCDVCGTLAPSGFRRHRTCVLPPSAPVVRVARPRPPRPSPSLRGHGYAFRRMRPAVLARDNHTCRICGRRATTVDYMVPWSKGGRLEWDNLQALCVGCNSRKRDRLPS